MELQELIARGRFVLAGAPGRQQVFSLVNGRRSTKAIAKESGKRLSNSIRDLQKLRDVGLIEPKSDRSGKLKKNDGATVYQKLPIVRHLSLTYFRSPSRLSVKTEHKEKRINNRFSNRTERVRSIATPNENYVIDICSKGEDQAHEFKAGGTDTRTVAKEVAGFLHTKNGGMILYGVEDDGRISGAGISRQKFDQSIQNSGRNMNSPAPNVRVHSVRVLESEIIVILISPWNRKEVFYYEGRAYVRKGTNVFQAKPEEIKRLHKGQHIV